MTERIASHLDNYAMLDPARAARMTGEAMGGAPPADGGGQTVQGDLVVNGNLTVTGSLTVGGVTFSLQKLLDRVARLESKR